MKKRYYHGTNRSFSHFIVPTESKNIKSPLGLLGVFFTEDPNLASDFTRVCWHNPSSKYKKGANVIPVTLNLNKTIEISAIKFLELSGRSDTYLLKFKNDLIEKGFDSILFKKPNKEDFCYETLISEFPSDQIVVFDNKNINFFFSNV